MAEVEVPFYEGLRIGIPSLPSLVETLTEGRFDLIHLATPGPVGVAAALTARIAGLPVLASHHTEFVAYARMRTGDESLAGAMALAMSLFYRECGILLSPSTSADDSLAALGVPPRRVARWVRGVDLSRFTPDLRRRGAPGADGRISVLYAGRQTREKGVDLLADAFLIAHARDPRLRLALAGGGPESEYLRERLGDTADFLGWLEGDELARAYADADVFVFPSETDTYGQVVVEAQASGVPVIAVRAGGPADLIDDGRSGLLSDPSPDEVAAKILRVADAPTLRDRLIRGGLAAAHERSWDMALNQLAEGYSLALAERVEVESGRHRRPCPPPDATRCPFTSRRRCRGAPRSTVGVMEASTELSAPEGEGKPETEAAPEVDLDDPSLYFNRELSWMDFNDRVLQLVEDESIPLLERVKFCAIWETNLDEFFMVRVAGLHDQVEASLPPGGADGMTPAEQIAAVRERTLAQRERLRGCFEGELLPALERARDQDRRLRRGLRRASARSSTISSAGRSSRR